MKWTQQRVFIANKWWQYDKMNGKIKYVHSCICIYVFEVDGQLFIKHHRCIHTREWTKIWAEPTQCVSLNEMNTILAVVLVV